MKPSQQFFALFRYLAFASPWIWAFPIAFGVQPCLMILMGNYWPSFASQLFSVTVFAILPLMTGAFIFAGDQLFAGTRGMTPQTYQQVQTFGGDFLLTRPIDRRVLFCARTAFYWTILVIPVLVLLGLSSLRPGISVTVPSKAPAMEAIYLEQLPGSSVSEGASRRNSVESPGGRLAFAEAVSLLALALAAVWPVLIYLILPLRRRKWIFWSVFIGICFLPLAVITQMTKPSPDLELFVLWMMSHHLLLFSVVLVLAVASTWFCATRDREIEFP